MREHNIAIIGLGYVGLPLALEFSKKYTVVGFDIDDARIKELNSGFDRTREADAETINSCLQNSLTLSSALRDIQSCNTYIVTVPTPIDANKKPDLGPLLSASTSIGKVLKKGDWVIYESTTYPGCTEEDCVPILEKESRLKYNQDFFCGYSPERINPGDKINTLIKIKKVTSGSTPEVAAGVDQLYASIIEAGTHLAPSIKVAEASKAIENAQRDINISFMNELALIFDKMNIDTLSVLEAASTKWNFLKFSPGLVGGHCISVDPYYLAYKAEQLGHQPQVILSGRTVNDSMSAFVANKLIRLLKEKENDIKKSRVLILGITFKENCPDMRNSKVPQIVSILESNGISVDIFDPWTDEKETQELGLNVLKSTQELSTYNGILLAVAHEQFKSMDLQPLKADQNKTVVFDLKGIFKGDDGVVRL
jgi:UDP-N-acetyl-D-galactosamine dehydrogenase